MIEHLVAIVALLIATNVDLKIREVPDTVSYGTIITGIIIGLLTTIITLNIWPLLNALFGFAIGAVIGVIMYYLGQWGGGDAKLIMGLGALFGAGAFFYNFLLYLIVAGAVYGLAYGFWMAWKNRKEFKKSFHTLAYTKKIKFVRVCFQIIVAAALICSFFLIQDFFLRITIVVLSAGSYLLFYAWIFAKALEEGCMKKKIPVDKLVEGDWVLEEVKIGKKVLVTAKYGITKEQIAELKKAKVKKVLVKEGIPFVPSFLLAYILTMVFFLWQGISLLNFF